MPRLGLALVLLGMLACSRAPPAPPVPVVLPNGLRTVIVAVPSARTVALVVLFDVGGDHDPPGKSGLAHLVEHLYVTAAAAGTPARAVESLAHVYPDGWNAQTGDRYTVVAGVFPPSRLGAESADAAARMGSLHLVEEDLARERPRVLQELDAMFRGSPVLAAMNRSRARVRPSPGGGQKGGLPEQVQGLTLEEATLRWTRLYKPANALVVLAGAVDSGAGAAMAGAFAAVPAGERAAPPAESPAGQGGSETLAGSPVTCAAWRAALPGDPDYPAFLALTGRLFARAPELDREAAVRFAPLDEPEVLRVCSGASLERIDAFVAAAIASTGGRDLAERNLGALLGFDQSGAAANVYGHAFGIGRRLQLGIDPRASRDALRAADPADAAGRFAPSRRGAAGRISP